VFQGCASADEEIQESSLSCLREIGVQEYEYLELYFAEVCAATSRASQS